MTIVELVVYEFDGFEMVRIYRSQVDDRAILVVAHVALLEPLLRLQPFLALVALDSLVVHNPVLDVKEFGSLKITMSALLLRQPENRQMRCIIISGF